MNLQNPPFQYANKISQNSPFDRQKHNDEALPENIHPSQNDTATARNDGKYSSDFSEKHDEAARAQPEKPTFEYNGRTFEITANPNQLDHTNDIKNILNKMKPGDTIMLDGNFTISDTLVLPSSIKWVLDGKIELDDKSAGELQKVGNRRTAITAEVGAKNIEMSGGIISGNGDNNQEARVRLVNFIGVTNSHFHDMIVQDSSDDCFTLGDDCQFNQVWNVTARWAGGKESRNGGNGLTDKGSHNKWFDCVAKHCGSDGWTPKCQYSEFYRCEGSNNSGPGWGCFARQDGYAEDKGELIIGNKFIGIIAKNNDRSGMSFNIANKSGAGAEIRDNIITGIFSNNGMSGVSFRNRTSDGIVKNNEIHIVSYENGANGNKAGGLGLEGDIRNIQGSVVAWRNKNYDINLDAATKSELAVYSYADKPKNIAKADKSSNIVDNGGRVDRFDGLVGTNRNKRLSESGVSLDSIMTGYGSIPVSTENEATDFLGSIKWGDLQEYNRNGNDIVNRDEFAEYLRSNFDPSLDNDQIKALFDEIDHDDSGWIRKEEVNKTRINYTKV